MKKNIHVTHLQFSKCVDYLRANKDRLVKERPTNQVVSEEMTKNLQFPVSPLTIKDIKEASGVTWNVVRATKELSVRGTKYRAALSHALCECISKLYKELGWDVPEVITEYIEKTKESV